MRRSCDISSFRPVASTWRRQGGVYVLRALGMSSNRFVLLFFLAFYQLGQNCNGFSCWGESCAVYRLSMEFWFVDRVLSSCRRHSRIIARSCMSGVLSVKSLGKLPPGSGKGIVS